MLLKKRVADLETDLQNERESREYLQSSFDTLNDFTLQKMKLWMESVSQKLKIPTPNFLEFISNPKKELTEEEDRAEAKPQKVLAGKRLFVPEDS